MKYLVSARFNLIDVVFLTLTIPITGYYGLQFGVPFAFLGGVLSATLENRYGA